MVCVVKITNQRSWMRTSGKGMKPGWRFGSRGEKEKERRRREGTFGAKLTISSPVEGSPSLHLPARVQKVMPSSLPIMVMLPTGESPNMSLIIRVPSHVPGL